MFIKNYKLILATIILYTILFCGVMVILAEDVPRQDIQMESLSPLFLIEQQTISSVVLHKGTNVQFKHGDISWLPDLAAQAGWPKDTWPRLGQIILRESGGCPNRYGGSIVDKNCNITGFDGSNHRSDSGLLQINGVHYKGKNSGLCRTMFICSQEPLLDPVTNLKAGKTLYDAVGWDPWDPCAWGPKYAHRCKP